MSLVKKNVRHVPLGDVARFIRGITFKPTDCVEPGTANSAVCMRTKNVQAELDQDDLIAVPMEFVKREEQILAESDILVSTANSWNLVGKCSWVPSLSYIATAGGFISILRPRSKQLHPRYLYQWFSSPSIQHSVRHCGRQTTNISNMSFERCLAIQIPLPPLAEQKRIADILDKADAIRRKRQQAIEQLRELPASLFQQHFGRAGSDAGINREYTAMTDLCDIIAGQHIATSLYSDLPSGTPYLTGPADFGESHPVVSKWTTSPKVLAKTGDVLVTVKGSGVGKSNLGCNAAIGRQLMALRPKPGRISQSFLFNFIRSVQSQIHQMAEGAAIPGITKSDLGSLTLYAAPLAEQNRFDEMVSHVDVLLAKMRTKLDTSITMFHSLQQRAFAGEL